MSKVCQIFETYGAVSEMQRTNENGRISLSGVFGVCGTRNNNHRVYEKANYGKMIAEMQERIKRDGGIPGTLEHENSMYVTLENVSHKITQVQIDENGVVTGTIELLDTPKGKIAQAIVEGGLPLFISSRAMGQVDRNGNVTLEKLSTYDIVSAPGFSQARLHLNESQVMESLGDNCCYVISENKDESEMEIKELLEKFTAMEARIEALEGENESLREQLSEVQAGNPDIKQLAESIQDWCVNHFAAGVEKWILEEFQGSAQEAAIRECKKVIVNQVAPLIQEWTVSEFAPQVEKWVCEQYSPQVEGWVIKQVAPGIQKWLIESYGPEIEKWVTENYSTQVRDMISESLSETRSSKLQSISEVLTMLESMEASKPQFGTRVITENAVEAPAYIKNMPETARVKYNMASKEIKESIDRRARIFDFSKDGAIERFWESVNFEEIKPTQSIYEGLDQIADQREREIRAAFRRHRAGI